MRLGAINRTRARFREVWLELDKLPVGRYYELPFRLWASVSRCLHVAEVKSGVRQNWLGLLRGYGLNIQVGAFEDDIHIACSIVARNEIERVQDDLEIVTHSTRAWRRYLTDDQRAYIRREQRLAIIEALAKPGHPFREAICNIEHWEESENVLPNSHGYPDFEDVGLTTTAIVRRPKR